MPTFRPMSPRGMANLMWPAIMPRFRGQRVTKMRLFLRFIAIERNRSSVPETTITTPLFGERVLWRKFADRQGKMAESQFEGFWGTLSAARSSYESGLRFVKSAAVCDNQLRSTGGDFIMSHMSPP